MVNSVKKKKKLRQKSSLRKTKKYQDHEKNPTGIIWYFYSVQVESVTKIFYHS